MRAALLIGLCACGRIAFDARPDASSTPDATCQEAWGPAVELPPAVPGGASMSVADDELELAVALTDDIHILSRPSKASAWGPPVVLPFPPNSSTFVDVAPSLTGDALAVYFTSTRMGNAFILRSTRPARSEAWGPEVDTGLKGGADVRADDLEIFIQDFMGPIRHATRASVAQSFSALEDVGALVNDGSLNVAPSVSADGRELYFSSDRGGAAQRQLWVASRAAPGEPFTTVEPLGFLGDDPEVSNDGHHLYFTVDTGVGYRYYLASRCE